MSEEKKDILEVLRFELKFLEEGGYDKSPLSWRAPYIFEDSPSCLNYKDRARSRPCSECTLMDLVPQELHGRDIPCRFIPLNETGDTVDSLYRSGTQQEMKEALHTWLCREIGRIEGERKLARAL